MKTLRPYIVQRVPAILKIIRREFGWRAIRILLRSALLALGLGLVIIASHLAALDLRPIGIISALYLGFSVYFGLLEPLGVLCLAIGIRSENLSRVAGAKRCYRLAAAFLRPQWKALHRLLRISESEHEIRPILAVLGRKAWVPVDTALVVADAYEKISQPQEAIEYLTRLNSRLQSSKIRLRLAGLYMQTGSPTSRIRAQMDGVEPDAQNDEFFSLRAAAELEDAPLSALADVERAIELRPCYSPYRVLKGRALEALGRHGEALDSYRRAIEIHEPNVPALIRIALIQAHGNEVSAALENLQRVVYYDNLNSPAYCLLMALQSGGTTPGIETLKRDSSFATITVSGACYDLTKDEVVTVEATVTCNTDVETAWVAALEPFGGGVELSWRHKSLGRIGRGEQLQLTLHATARRSSDVNLGKPWPVNLLFASGTRWANTVINFQIRDETEGRILFVLTEDHEVLLERRPAGVGAISADSARRDLIDKHAEAQRLAEAAGLKWTHMLDVGTALTLPSWAASLDQSWDALTRDLTTFYENTYSRGHDVQLHIHMSAVPGSHCFEYTFVDSDAELTCDLDQREQRKQKGQANNWAAATPSLGNRRESNTRTGSLSYAISMLEELLIKRFPTYGVSLFRPGGWDFGKNLAEREKSLVALRRNSVLADSSVTSFHSSRERGFSFGRPPLECAYFTDQNNANERATSLVDCGLLEISPILRPEGLHPTTPRSHPRSVLNAYHQFLSHGRIKPGVHIILEMEHICTIDRETKRKVDPTASDWRKLTRHFSSVRRHCPRLEGCSAHAAIMAWLDYYLPEVLAVVDIDDESRLSQDTPPARFRLTFLGSDAITEGGRLHELRLWPPSVLGSERGARILKQGKPVSVIPPGQHSPKLTLFLKRGDLGGYGIELFEKTA